MTDTSPQERFFKPGVAVLGWLDKHHLRKELPWVPFVVTACVAASFLLWGASQNWFTFLLAMTAVVGQAWVSYLQGAERQHTRTVRQRAWTEFASHKQEVAGLLALLGQQISDKTELTTEDRLRRLQELVLDEIARLIARARRLSDDRVLSANWCLRTEQDDGPVYRVVAYNRAMADRNVATARSHRICEGELGSSECFLTGQIAFIDDTRAEPLKDRFPDTRPYRQILSIPVAIDSEEVLGVVNVDSRRVGALSKDAHRLVEDLVILVGVCEILLRDRSANRGS